MMRAKVLKGRTQPPAPLEREAGLLPVWLLALALWVVVADGVGGDVRSVRRGRRKDRQPSLEEQIADDPAFAHLKYDNGGGPVPGVRSWWRR